MTTEHWSDSLIGERPRGEPEEEWQKRFAHRKVLELDNAAHILAGARPEVAIGRPPEEISDISYWVDRLYENLDELLAKGGAHSNHFFHQLSHEKIRIWCDKEGIVWPIPPNPWVEANHTEAMTLRRQIEQERAARKAIETEVARLRQQLDDEFSSRQAAEDGTTREAADTQNYLNPSHPRYSYKLDAAVRAWQAMEDESLTRTSTPKAAVETWLETNYLKLDLVWKEDINKQAIVEISKVVNWDQKGGAPKTPAKRL